MTDRLTTGAKDTAAVRVASAWINDDGYSDVVTATGGQVKVFAGGTDNLAGTPVDNVTPLSGAEAVFIAAANDPGSQATTISQPAVNPGNALISGQMFEALLTVTDNTTSTLQNPTGTITWYARDYYDSKAALIPLGQSKLTSVGADSSETVLRIRDVVLPALDYTIVANYAGDSNFASSSVTLSTVLGVTTPSAAPWSTPVDNSACATCDNPVQTAAGSGTNASPAVGAGGVRLFDGSVSVKRSDLESGGFGLAMAVPWTWTNAKGVADGMAGSNSRSTALPLIQQANGNASVALVMNCQVQYFDKIDDGYVGRFCSDLRLSTSTGIASFVGDDSRFNLLDGSGAKFVFFDFDYSTVAQRGKLEKIIDAAGNETDVVSDSAGFPTEVTRVYGTGSTQVTES